MGAQSKRDVVREIITAKRRELGNQQKRDKCKSLWSRLLVDCWIMWVVFRQREYKGRSLSSTSHHLQDHPRGFILHFLLTKIRILNDVVSMLLSDLKTVSSFHTLMSIREKESAKNWENKRLKCSLVQLRICTPLRLGASGREIGGYGRY